MTPKLIDLNDYIRTGEGASPRSKIVPDFFVNTFFFIKSAFQRFENPAINVLFSIHTDSL